MRRILAFLSIIFVSTISSLTASEINFPLQLSFTVPGLTGPISQAKFNDINRDGFPEVLATDGLKVVLYSITDDSILFNSVIDSAYHFEAFLFDDVTRDSIPDLVIASQENTNIYPAINGPKIDLFNGANNFAHSSRTLDTNDIGAAGYDRFGFLDAIDADSDGYNELLISTEGIESWSNELYTSYNNFGVMFLYRRFPDSLLWRSGAFATAINQFKITEDTSAVWVTESYWSFRQGFGPNWNVDRSWQSLLLQGGQLKVAFGDSADNCSGEYISYGNLNSFGCVGDLDIDKRGVEVISVFRHYDSCYPEQVPTEFFRLQMRRVVDRDSTELLWSRDTSNLDLYNFLYDPTMPGYFLAFTGNVLYLFRGGDGSVRTSTVAPFGVKHWDYPFANNEPRLITLQGDLVSIYRLDISLDYNEGENRNELPTTFTLGQNFPNPFNLETRIKFALPQASNVSIDVLNILGQRVKNLINERKPAGKYEIEWDGKDEQGSEVSSGVYFYRITASDYAQTKKMMLLK